LNAYSAGLLDGEGCIRWNSSPTVEITNKHHAVLVQMRRKWGGRVRDKGEGVYVWTVYGRKALKYLMAVARYSVIKYPQIATLFKAVSSTGKRRTGHLARLRTLKHVYAD